MVQDAKPQSPVYMTYIYNLPSPASALAHAQQQARSPALRQPAAQEPCSRSEGAEARDRTRPSRPYHPTTNTSPQELDLHYSKSIYHNFHAPTNSCNRFLVGATAENKAAFRLIERASPPPFGNPGRRPSSAPPTRPVRDTYTPEERRRLEASVQQLSTGGLANSLVTAYGIPSFTAPATIKAHLDEGTPLVGEEPAERWRTARVETYVVPPHPLGFGPGGAKPFHQDYRHYKYYGFAGKGAKTSWAHNPKESIVSAYAYAGRKSGYKKYLPSDMPPRYSDRAEVVDPHLETVDILTRRPVAPPGPDAAVTQRCAPAFSKSEMPTRVLTYRKPANWHYTLQENPSPNAGSQSPFTQRYTHYKYHGFAGKGATSSWARNPKHALLV